MSPAPFLLAPLDAAHDRTAHSEVAAFALMVDAKGDAAAAFSKRATLVHRFVDKLTNEIDAFVRQARREPQP